MEPTRMTRSYVTNEGAGPYAVFSCDQCGREYRSTPSLAREVKDTVTRSAFGGLLRNIPLVGGSMADQVEGDRYRNTMTSDELATAWGQVRQYFRECPTCHQIVCVPDFDEIAGFCADDSPRRADIEAARAQQAVATMAGVADALGIKGAFGRVLANAQADQAAPSVGPTPTTPSAASTSGAACGSCGAALAAGARFCPSCGTPVAQPGACSSCGTQLGADARFCASCGTPAGT